MGAAVALDRAITSRVAAIAARLSSTSIHQSMSMMRRSWPRATP